MWNSGDLELLKTYLDKPSYRIWAKNNYFANWGNKNHQMFTVIYKINFNFISHKILKLELREQGFKIINWKCVREISNHTLFVKQAS